MSGFDGHAVLGLEGCVWYLYSYRLPHTIVLQCHVLYVLHTSCPIGDRGHVAPSGLVLYLTYIPYLGMIYEICVTVS